MHALFAIFMVAVYALSSRAGDLFSCQNALCNVLNRFAKTLEVLTLVYHNEARSHTTIHHTCHPN